MRFMLLPDDYCEPAPRPRWPSVPFEVGIAALILALCVLYGLVFGSMIYVSLQEQVVAPHAHAPGRGGLPHFHSPAEWALLVFPAVVAWSGTFSSLRYLVRRARPRR
ncbi:MAG TPA: hypothetical protein VFE37_07165 [Chloroflexota bacterium]|nr:hypothetical protein [Chloroflexota bacterium]